MNLFSHIQPSSLHYELTNRGARRTERAITYYRFPKVSNNLLENNIGIDHNSPSPFRNNQSSPRLSGFSESILPWTIQKCLAAVMPLPWRVFPVFSFRPPPSHGRNVPRKPRLVGGVKGHNMNDTSFPGSPALWAESFTSETSEVTSNILFRT